MKPFETFVHEIAAEWRKLEAGGKIRLSRVAIGQAAEKYILYRVKKVLRNYYPVISPGSRTAADIYAIDDHAAYIHIILIQVKASAKSKEAIKKLGSEDLEDLKELSELVHRHYPQSALSKTYTGKQIIVTTGYAGVFFKTHRHSLSNAHYISSCPEGLGESMEKMFTRMHTLEII